MQRIKALLASLLLSFAFHGAHAAVETVYFCSIKNGASWETNVVAAVEAGWADTGNHGTAAADGNYSYPARFNKGLSITSPVYTRPITSVSVFARVSNLARALEVIPYNAQGNTGATLTQTLTGTSSAQLVTVNLPDLTTHKVNLTFTVSGSSTAYGYYVMIETAENQAPAWVTPFAPALSPAAPIAGRPVTLNLTGCVTDPDGSISSVTYSDGNGLSGAVVDNACTLTFPAAGIYTLTFTATDNEGATSTATYTLNVAENSAPALSIDPDTLSILEGQQALATISATDDEGDPITLALTSGPDGATFDSATGAFAWTPSAAGSYAFTFSAADSYGASSTATLSITVAEASQNVAPVLTIDPESLAVNVLGTCSANVSATDANGDIVTLAMTSSLPGATFDPATGAFAWTPTVAGSYTATFSADDGNGGVTSIVLPITVSNAAPTLSLALENEAALVAGEPITVTLTATDLFAAALLSSAHDFGSLGATSSTPEGDTITTTATWTFTPTAAGSYSLSFVATDANDNALTTSRSLELTVGLATPAVTVTDRTDTSATLDGDAVPGATTYTVALTGAQVHETSFLMEDFSKVTKDNNTAFANSSKFNENTIVPGWNGLNVYPKGGKIQLGKGEDPGMLSYLITPPLAALSGSKLHFSLRLVNNSKHVLTLVAATVDASDTVRDVLTIGPFPVDSTKANWIECSDVDIGLDVESGDRLRFSVIAATEATPDTRFLMDDIEVFGTGLLTPVSTTQTFTTLPATLTDLAPSTYYTATLTAGDGTVSSDAATVTFTTTKSVDFTFGEPVENAIATTCATQPISFTVSAFDGDTPCDITFDMDADEANPPTFSNGLFSWTPTDADVGSNLVTFRAGNGTAIVTINVTARPALVTEMPTANVIDWHTFSLTWDTTQMRDSGVYGLRIWSGSCVMGSASSDQETFTAIPMKPENWIFSRSFDTYNSNAYHVKIDGSAADWIISKCYPKAITSVKFTTRKYSGNGSVLTVYGSKGDTENWTEIASITVASETEHELGSEFFAGKNYRRLKWEVTNRDGNFGFGRVIVGYEGAGTRWLLGSAETPASVTAEEIPVLIANARPNTEYFVQLILNGDSGEYLDSDYLRVQTPEAPQATVILVK